MSSLRIATRKSLLALWQAEHVQRLLGESGETAELIPMVSVGDTDMRPIDGTRQVGVFTKRIQQALLQQEADIAVHSLKDLPTEVNPSLVLAAVPERETIEDALVSTAGWTLEQLPQNAIIGTGSKRRGAQLLNQRPDLKIENIRGNVQTRLEKLKAGEYDAIILAEAGILRLGLNDLERSLLPLGIMLPAPGQGALGIEVRSDDERAFHACQQLDHPQAHAAVHAERTLLAALHGGCLAPIAALGEVNGQTLSLKATVLSGDGKQRVDHAGSIQIGEDYLAAAAELASELAAALEADGARELINAGR
ncbi:MAG: hydroxymethylbilane synthase [Rubripirellula sp.]|nr:hydroxymethylbilane synthase [Rubripirellula sp.]